MNDYTKFSKELEIDETVEQTIVEQNEEVQNVDETVVDETVIEPIETGDQNEESLKATLYVQGVVKASKLNIRKEANKNADVLTVISKGTGVEINLTDSTEDFYCVKVLVNSELTDGYAMKEFIDLK